jgi:hypothetical protein
MDLREIRRKQSSAEELMLARDAIRVGCGGTQAEEPLPALCYGLQL